MKYHYKSPEEVQEELHKKTKRVHPFRNRNFLTILADTAIIAIVLAILLIFMRDLFIKSPESNLYEQDGLIYSASVSTSGSRNLPLLKYYIKIKNTTNTTVNHPPETAALRVSKDGVLLVETTLHMEERIIAPGETELYRFTPEFKQLENILNREGIGVLVFEFEITQNGKTIRLNTSKQ